MKALRCCIIDEDADTIKTLSALMRKMPVFDLAGVFENPQQATKVVLSGTIDVVFLAAEMSAMSGVEFARILPRDTRVVFVASSTKHAYDAFRVGAVDYLLRPISEADYVTAVNRVVSACGVKREGVAPNRFLIVKSDYKLLQIPLDDILFIEGLKDYVKIYLVQDQKSVMTLMSMRMLERYLPPTMFMRIHRSYIINLTHLRMIERARVVFGSHYLPISESYKNAFNDYIAANSVSPDSPSGGD